MYGYGGWEIGGFELGKHPLQTRQIDAVMVLQLLRRSIGMTMIQR